MPPPKGSVGANCENASKQMQFRRASSTSGNQSADEARSALSRAFEAADLDRSGMIDKDELNNVIRNQLHVQLQDPINDIDIIFDSLDADKSGLVSMDEFCKLFEPSIIRRASSAGTMDVDDLMKETFSAILFDAKLERSIVIQGFMRAHAEIEKSGKGFGKAYWGSKWRFKLVDGFYTHPKDAETGRLVDVINRYPHLISRLDAAIAGTDPWLNKQFEQDEDMKKEVQDRSVVAEYCKIWVDVLREREHELQEVFIRRASSAGMQAP